jgi:hypothetical protein
MPLSEYTALLAREMTRTLNRAAREAEGKKKVKNEKCKVKNEK